VVVEFRRKVSPKLRVSFHRTHKIKKIQSVVTPFRKISYENKFSVKCFWFLILLRGLFGSLHILHDTPHRVAATGINFVYLNPFDVCVTVHH